MTALAPDHPDFLGRARDIIHEAALAVEILYDSRDFQVASKGEAGPVTSADLVANFFLLNGLRELLPDAGWLSEESADDKDRLQREDVWIVDPIDGTREFVKGVPEFSVSVGLVRNGEPFLGLIALPADRIVIYGARGQGIRKLEDDPGARDFFADDFRDLISSSTPEQIDEFLSSGPTVRRPGASRGGVFRELPVKFSRREDLSGAKMLISASEHRRGKFKPFAGDFRLEPSGSVARKLGLLAAGAGDLNVSLYPKNEWDICGGTALVLAAGGAVIELESLRVLEYNRENTRSLGLAAGPVALVKKFAEYFQSGGFGLETSYS